MPTRVEDYFPDAAELIAAAQARRGAEVVVYSCRGTSPTAFARAQEIAFAGLEYGLTLGEIEDDLADEFGRWSVDVSIVSGIVEIAIDAEDTTAEC